MIRFRVLLLPGRQTLLYGDCARGYQQMLAPLPMCCQICPPAPNNPDFQHEAPPTVCHPCLCLSNSVQKRAPEPAGPH